MLENRSLDEDSLFTEEVNLEIRKTIQENSGALLTKMITEHFDQPGKMLRPRMIYGIGLALGVPMNSLIHWAASCEMLHNGTLIHDDLQDGDEYRRGQPATWKKYGAAQAINAGDLLLLASPQPIHKSPLSAEIKAELHFLFSRMSSKVVNGQCLEFSLKDRLSQSTLELDYFDCIAAKTAALFAESARGVSLIARKDHDFQIKIADLFDRLGKVFQIQDDILDLYGDKQRDSKGCDLKEGKISFLVVTHLKHNPNDLAYLEKILSKDRELTTLDDINEVENLFKQKNTLPQSMKYLSTMINGIVNDPWLKEYSALQSYVQQITRKILEPIQFLI